MYAFLLLCLPCLSLYLMLANRQYSFKSFLPPALIGLITAIAVCAIRGFFITYTHLWTDSFFSTLIFVTLRDTLIPTVIMCGLFFLFSKDTWNYKSESVAPLMGFFLSVYIPFIILSGSNMEAHTAFMFLVKPLLIAAYILSLSVLVKKAVSSFSKNDKRFGLIFSAACLVLMFIPAFIEALWYLHFISILWIALTLIFVVEAVILYLFFNPKEVKEERIPIFMTMDN